MFCLGASGAGGLDQWQNAWLADTRPQHPPAEPEGKNHIERNTLKARHKETNGTM